MSVLLVGEYIVSLLVRQSGAFGKSWRKQSTHIVRGGSNGWWPTSHCAAPGAR